MNTPNSLALHIYNLYCMDWIRRNGYTLDDLIVSVLTDVIIPESPNRAEVEEGARRAIPILEREVGFNGKCWKTKNVFWGSDYLRPEFIDRILHDMGEAEKIPAYREHLVELTRDELVGCVGV